MNNESEGDTKEELLEYDEKILEDIYLDNGAMSLMGSPRCIKGAYR